MSEQDRAKWNAKYSRGEAVLTEPSAVLRQYSELLPSAGKALDVAGGAGRHSIWLAGRGCEVSLADISPAGLEIAAARAKEAGVSIQTVEVDLEMDSLPAGPWNLILCVRFIRRPLFQEFIENLAPGGTLCVLHPTRKNLERHDKPPQSFLLDEGELKALVAGLEVAVYEEGWLADDRHNALVIARRPLS